MRAWMLSLCLLPLAAPAIARDEARTERVSFARGTSSKVIKSSVRGYDVVDYLVGARAGQTLSVKMTTSNAASYFNVSAAGADQALFVGSTSGNAFSGKLPASGDYKVQVYLMRNAARRGETAKYTLTIAVR